ncbi:AAA family ATPase [Demequina oxidasica]|uniref:AAA family ATPase n=1 Tax=Demequina oxidasica TaxID=676199 RepID=UPI0007814FC7|nr:AAA family ATPase [Demequina oxidasica]
MKATDGSEWKPHDAQNDRSAQSDGASHEEDVRGASWRDRGLGDVIRDVTDGTWIRPVPSVCVIEGSDCGLFYPGKVNGIHGVAGVGKSLLLAYSEVQEINAGHHVVHVDFEDDEYTLVSRLLDLNAKPENIEEYLHYKKPEESSRYGITFFHDTITKHKVALVGIDSTGESMAMDGVKANEDHEVARWLRLVGRAAADLGPAVVLLDHVPKAAEDALMSIGSQRKSAGINGAIYSLRGDKPFARDKSGSVRIVCGKDRGGNYAKGSTVAEYHFNASDASFTLRDPEPVFRTADGTVKPTRLMERVSQFLEANPGSNQSATATGCSGRKGEVVFALSCLEEDGFVVHSKGPHNARLYKVVKPYRAPKNAGGHHS